MAETTYPAHLCSGPQAVELPVETVADSPFFACMDCIVLVDYNCPDK